MDVHILRQKFRRSCNFQWRSKQLDRVALGGAESHQNASLCNDPRAMPLSDFCDAMLRVLGTDTEEVIAERAKPLRNNAGPNEAPCVNESTTCSN
jgi:hypothetical protein